MTATTAAFSIYERIEQAIATILDLIQDGYICQVGLSGGKDSSLTTILMLEAVRRAKLAGCVQGIHTISSASTGVESPIVESNLLALHDEIGDFAAREDLPVTVKTVHPSLASSFVVSTLGRGTLPRFPENGKHRSCSVEWKIKPAQRLGAAIGKLAQAEGFKEVVSIIGVRFSESAARMSRMNERGDSAVKPVRNADGRLVLSPIADWTLQDVWDMLELFLDPSTMPFPSFTDGKSIYRLFEMYRDANEGACGINLGDGGNKAPCGPRFGCWNCCIVGSNDRSMDSLLRDEKYAFMQGLSDYRNLLIATQYDLSRRELVGRTISNAGHLAVRPDVYNLGFRRNLLAYLITLDVLEEERAEQLEADIITGRVANTPENRRMAGTQFCHVSLEALTLVDFFWSMHHYAPHAFPAIALWHEIRTLGRRYAVPKLERHPTVPIPEKRWYPVGQFDREVPTDGLRCYQSEQFNPYRHPDRLFSHRQIGKNKVVWFDEEDSLDVDSEKACAFVTCEYPEMMIASRNHYAIESARFWLNEGIVKLPSGMAARYDHICRRGQYFAHLLDSKNLTPAELDAYLLANSISDTDHSILIGDQPQPVSTQQDLFALLAA